jgi:hypothetical protein
MIFSKTAAYNSKHLQNLACREVYAAEPATPAFLQWSRSLITFNRTDHLNNIPHLGKYPLMVNPIISKKWLTKVLMDGGTCLNIMYAEMFDVVGIDRMCIRSTGAPFHGIMQGKQAKPLGQINLPVTFGIPSNFMMEDLTFELVGFHGTYHAILGCPCYVKFMAVHNYMYLKLKMPGLCRVITVGTSFQRAYECEVECCELTAATIAFKELVVIREEIVEEAPNSKWSTRSFEPIEGTKEVLIDPSST